MTESTNKGGRPKKSSADKLQQGSTRLTSAQWAKVAAGGGQPWLRMVIDKTDVPPLPAKPNQVKR